MSELRIPGDEGAVADFGKGSVFFIGTAALGAAAAAHTTLPLRKRVGPDLDLPDSLVGILEDGLLSKSD